MHGLHGFGESLGATVSLVLLDGHATSAVYHTQQVLSICHQKLVW